jgi:hypothetical protein
MSSSLSLRNTNRTTITLLLLAISEHLGRDLLHLSNGGWVVPVVELSQQLALLVELALLTILLSLCKVWC